MLHSTVFGSSARRPLAGLRFLGGHLAIYGSSAALLRIGSSVGSSDCGWLPQFLFCPLGRRKCSPILPRTLTFLAQIPLRKTCRRRRRRSKGKKAKQNTGKIERFPPTLRRRKVSARRCPELGPLWSKTPLPRACTAIRAKTKAKHWDFPMALRSARQNSLPDLGLRQIFRNI